MTIPKTQDRPRSTDAAPAEVRGSKPKVELIQGDGSGESGGFNPLAARLYAVYDGQRYLIPDLIAFRSAGYEADQIRVVPDAELERIPLVNPRLSPGEELTLDLHTDLGSGHFMTTWGVLRKGEGGAHIDATTRTQTVTLLGGYHGAVSMVYSDAQGYPVARSETQTYGVDGRWIGRSDRTEYWSQDLPQDVAARVAQLTIFHFWNPRSLQDTIRRLADTARPIIDIIAEVQRMGGGARSS